MGAVVIGVSAWLVVTLSCARWPLLPLRPAHPCFSLNSQPLNHHPRTDPPPLALESPHPFHNIQDKLASDCDPTPPSPLLSHPVFRKLIYPLSLPLPPRLVLHTTFHLHHLLATLIVAPPLPAQLLTTSSLTCSAQSPVLLHLLPSSAARFLNPPAYYNSLFRSFRVLSHQPTLRRSPSSSTPIFTASRPNPSFASTSSFVHNHLHKSSA